MVMAEANDASGNRALAVPEAAGKRGGSAEYSIASVPAGDYRVWLRAFWRDSCSNSIGCVIAGETVLLADEIFAKWHWVGALRTISLPAGEARIRLQNTEDGVMIDQILMARDPGLVPHGVMAPPPAQAEPGATAPGE